MNIRNAFDRLIAAREKQALRYVNGALLGMDDETLARAGIKREDLKAQGSSYLPL